MPAQLLTRPLRSIGDSYCQSVSGGMYVAARSDRLRGLADAAGIHRASAVVESVMFCPCCMLFKSTAQVALPRRTQSTLA